MLVQFLVGLSLRILAAFFSESKTFVIRLVWSPSLIIYAVFEKEGEPAYIPKLTLTGDCASTVAGS